MKSKLIELPSEFSVANCYDSHAHFVATGDFANRPDLKFLKSKKSDGAPVAEDDLKAQLSEFVSGDPHPLQFKNLSHELKPRLEELFLVISSLFPNRLVSLTFEDGHSSLINQFAENYLKSQGFSPPSNHYLSEETHFAALEHWPKPSSAERELRILKAQEIFVQGGFSHVRDMTMDFADVPSLMKTSEEGLLKIGLECFFLVNQLSDVPGVIQQVQKIQTENGNSNLRFLGIKIFYDGTLGAQTALMSQCYQDSSQQGHRLWALSDLESALTLIWKAKLEVAVHAIGDLAVDEVVTAARKVSASGVTGFLNIEHAEILTAETIQKMKPLHVRIHSQPSHWLSDRNFVGQRLPQLKKWAFPLERIRLAQIPLFFGCDSPIFDPSLISNVEGLNQLVSDGYSAFLGNVLDSHSHPDKSFAPAITRFIKQEERWSIQVEFKN